MDSSSLGLLIIIVSLVVLSGCIQSDSQSKNKIITVTQVSNNPDINATFPEKIEHFSNSSFKNIFGVRELLERVSSNESLYRGGMPANKSQIKEFHQAYNESPSGLFNYNGEVYRVAQTSDFEK